MTEKGMLKKVGKRVCVEMHEFPHSIATNIYRGIVESEKSTSAIIRDGHMKITEHHDFWLIPEDKNDKAVLIKWNEIKLIISCNEY